eukprot:GSChrysophyteH2.ASY1.ANO1.1252.1 assembled CDS
MAGAAVLSILICLGIGLNNINAAGAFPLEDPVVDSLSQLRYDENNRLAENYLLISDNEGCKDIVRNAWNKRPDYKFLTIKTMSQNVVDLYPILTQADTVDSVRNSHNTGHFVCHSVALDRGTDRDHILHQIPEKHHTEHVANQGTKENPAFSSSMAAHFSEYHDFLDNSVMKVEFGFLNWKPNDAKIYWVDIVGDRRVFVSDLKRKEKNTQWQTTTLGHVFEVEDAVTGEIFGRYEAQHPSINVIGTPRPEDIGHPMPNKIIGEQVRATFNAEWRRANRVTRTFTELGFSKGKLPDDLFQSIRTYYYNNRMQLAREEWDDKGLFVNWWEVEAYMIAIPWRLKSYWQRRLMPLVEAWGGVELELTDIYGMRRYEDGARLLTHVDREQTHAVSLIINIAQIGMREPWMLEIYDFAGRLHEVEMDEGDIVYYESARCLHGRMKALHGTAYINLFAHYRPIGDPDWFTKQNPDDTPEQCLDVSQAAESVQALYKQYISPRAQTLSGPETLFDHWVDMGSEAKDSHNFVPVSECTGISSEL